MNFKETLQSVELILAARDVPLLVGETGIGKTALASYVAKKNDWSLLVIDGNLLKEGEIGGLPTITTYTRLNAAGKSVKETTTTYAIHHTLRAIDEEIANQRTVLLFIDEINRCEHAVQQEVMNLILNKEINGYHLHPDVRIIAAMNPSDSYDYETVNMDLAQQNRFVWLYMEPDYAQWLDWAETAGIEPEVREFIATFPDYLNQHHEDDIHATPRSYERISKAYKIYKEKKQTISKSVFFNVIRGNVGKVIAEEFTHFIESDHLPLLTYNDIFEGSPDDTQLQLRIQKESHTRLYLTAKNIFMRLEKDTTTDTPLTAYQIKRIISLLAMYPVDLMIGMMKDMRCNTPHIYHQVLNEESFVNLYFKAYCQV